MSIVIYTRNSCPYCAMAKELLHSKGVEWTEINIEAGAGRRGADELFGAVAASGQRRRIEVAARDATQSPG